MPMLFLGMSGAFSYIVLERLLAADMAVAAVLIAGERFRLLPPASPSIEPFDQDVRVDRQMQDISCLDSCQSNDLDLELRLLNPYIAVAPTGPVHCGASEQQNHGLRAERATGFAHRAKPELRQGGALQLAWQAGIPAYECGGLSQPQVSTWLANMSLDVACVACWNRIIPATVLGIPRHGFLNAHPSLLPAYRGPQPLFWQFRAGETDTGVTVHWMDAGMDTGDIAGQRTLTLADGIRAADAEALCASVAGDLLADVLAALAQGKAVRQPQPAGGSYFPVPTVDDFALDTAWPVQRAFNFMRGTAEWGLPYRLEVDGAVRWLLEALSWQESMPAESAVDGNVCVRFSDGALWARESPGRPV